MPIAGEELRESYKALSKYLVENIPYDKEVLSIETLTNMISASCLFDMDNNAKTSVLMRDPINPTQAISVKFSNVHFDLSKAFDIVLLLPIEIPASSELELLKFAIGIMKLSWDSTKIDISDDSAIVAKHIYLLDYDKTGVPEEKLFKELNTRYSMDDSRIEAALNELKLANSIVEVYKDNESQAQIKHYHVTESVLLNIK